MPCSIRTTNKIEAYPVGYKINIFEENNETNTNYYEDMKSILIDIEEYIKMEIEKKKEIINTETETESESDSDSELEIEDDYFFWE